MSSRVTTVLAFAGLVVGVVGTVLTIVLGAPYDPQLVTWKLPILLFAVVTIATGWILAWKRPAIPIGWLLLVVSGLAALQGPAIAVSNALRDTDPVAAGWVVQLGPESSWTWIVLLGTVVALIPLRFPNGRLPSPRWRWFWWASLAAMLWSILLAATFEPSMQLGIPNPSYVPWGDALGVVELGSILPLVVVMIGALASLFVRYRRADAVERAQLRWLFWALAIVVALLLLGGIESAIFGDEDSGGVTGLVGHIIGVVTSTSYVLIPLAILVAVLRSGLYGIDRIISRTAAYATVTLGVVVVYVGVVLLGSILLPDSPSVPVAAATLAAAAVFLPLLRVIRRRVDRRFDRAQYDARAVVDAFGERIRTGADPHSSSDDLVAAVQLALQPSAIGIWRREAS